MKRFSRGLSTRPSRNHPVQSVLLRTLNKASPIWRWERPFRSLLAPLQPPPPRGEGRAPAEAGGEARRQIGLEGIAMNQEIRELAREALLWFQCRTWYWTIKNGAPEWV